jgi:hypothetical protein
MERGNSPQRFEEVDSPPAMQHHRADDRAFTGSNRQLRTGGISMGSLRYRQALPRAQAGLSRPMVERMEGQVLVHAAAVDVEGRANVLLR